LSAALDTGAGRERVAIVGGGAAGSLAAVQLLQRPAGGRELEVHLVDSGGRFARGVAYGTDDRRHLLNVPAIRMGALPARPEHFHEWLRRTGRDLPEAAFVPRGLYGDYLAELLDEAEAAATAHRARLRRCWATVQVIAPAADGALRVELEGAEPLTVDRVVLALGPPRGADPIEVPPALRRSGVWVDDPWATGALDEAAAAAEVLILGTGLTMVDAALSLGDRPGGPRVHAYSRSGRLPRRHRRDLTRVERFPLPADCDELGPIVAAVRARVAEVGERGGDWRDVVDSLRPEVPALWRGLRLEEKRRFLAEFHRAWDVHRFRMAPDVADRLEQLCRSHRVSWGGGRVLALEPLAAGGARVTLGTEEGVTTLEVGRILNCTGSRCDFAAAPPAPLGSLLDAGLVRPEPLGIGLDVAPDGAAVEASGQLSGRVFVIGALRKGVEWEALGITEIREQAGAVARALLSPASRPA
jgi:uncharacterized NAD(P)/FAD-binding protein YdhS